MSYMFLYHQDEFENDFLISDKSVFFFFLLMFSSVLFFLLFLYSFPKVEDLSVYADLTGLFFFFYIFYSFLSSVCLCVYLDLCYSDLCGLVYEILVCDFFFFFFFVIKLPLLCTDKDYHDWCLNIGAYWWFFIRACNQLFFHFEVSVSSMILSHENWCKWFFSLTARFHTGTGFGAC